MWSRWEVHCNKLTLKILNLKGVVEHDSSEWHCTDSLVVSCNCIWGTDSPMHVGWVDGRNWHISISVWEKRLFISFSGYNLGNNLRLVDFYNFASKLRTKCLNFLSEEHWTSLETWPSDPCNGSLCNWAHEDRLTPVTAHCAMGPMKISKVNKWPVWVWWNCPKCTNLTVIFVLRTWYSHAVHARALLSSTTQFKFGHG